MSALRDALRDLSDAAFFDLLESDEAYLLVLDVPGVSPETIDVAVDGGRIRIEARRKKSLPGQFKYIEENRSLFVDVDVPVPKDAVEAEAAATVDRGVLELRLPKQAGTEETTIDVVEQKRAEDRHDETGDPETAASTDETTPEETATDEER
ncbi:Hsp20/alpha crystallin family protein [Halobacteria archaeon AArc-curdl1]|uniref:Hsp20/alpha crystallin family protein n=1 Tax=Natronosalvus hydrolyticus TaxID=2979988 RepID=A0AAP3E4S4_9EURY|nr:Hsp20/alpha crystallin family protein [Halobacteria archaeon AArc-curdl1]